MTTETSPSTKELLAKALRELKEMRAQVAALRQGAGEPIAIVGMGCRFPGGADSPGALWDVLAQGRNAVGTVPADRWDAEALYDPDPEAEGKLYTRLGGFIDRVAEFDPGFFGLAPREAAHMDPQQRLLLEVAWEALEHSGLPIEALAGTRTGVYVGLASSDYSHLLAEASGLADIDAYVLTGNAPNVAAGRLAFVLGLQGPAMAVDTACSSSLVSVHLACQSLRNRECDTALAAGVNLILSPVSSIAFCRMQALARGGYCRTFDAAADGFIRGEGCGVVVLKRLADALAAGDTVQAVIRGSAVNQDGHTSALTVPNGPAQQAVIRAALAHAGVAPETVGYVEAHGTGTPLGDPIELQALAEAYRRVLDGGGEPAPLYVGSIKTNFGHLEAAAGIAGLIKAVLVLQRGAIPPHLHFHEPNPRLDWARTTLRVPTGLSEWPAGAAPRRAAVSAFGFSGTNAHLVLEAGPPTAVAAEAEARAQPGLFVLSARSEAQLRALAERTAEFLGQTAAPLAALCQASQMQRSHWAWRLAVVAENVADLRQKLADYVAGERPSGLHTGQCRPHSDPVVAWVFSGQGGQRVGMGRGLYASQPAFRAAFDACAQAAAPYLDRSLSELCFDEARAGEPFDDPVASQVGLFSLQVALARLWQSWGVEPAVVLGQSLGEYAAAVITGVFSLEEALSLVAERASLMRAQGVQGGVVVVRAALETLRPYLEQHPNRVWPVGLSGPGMVTLSGHADAVEALGAALAEAGMQVSALRGFDRSGYPVHTPLMEPVIAGLRPLLERARAQRPALDFISSYTGERVDAALTTADYWVAQSRQPFDMERAVSTLISQRPAFVIELGPGAATLAVARRFAPDAPVSWLPSLRDEQADLSRMLESLAALHVGGVDVNWHGLHGGRRVERVELPLTPFLRHRYWFEARTAEAAKAPAVSSWLGDELPTPLDAKLYSAVLAPDTFGFLRDHQVHGRVVVAAGAHLARAVAAAHEHFGRVQVALSAVAFTQPLVLAEAAPRLCQLAWQPEAEGRARVIIASAPSGEARPAWIEHMSGQAAHIEAEALAAVADLPALQARCTEAASAEAFYDELAVRGYRFGPAFRWITGIHRGRAEAVCRLRAPAAVDQAAGGAVSPGLVDACLQCLSAVTSTAGLPAYVPYAVDELRFYAASDGPTWCHAVAHGERGGAMVSGDLRLYDEGGRLVLELIGLHGRQVSAEELRQAGAASLPAADLFYHVAWPEAPKPDLAAVPAEGTWLLLADSAGVGAALAERLCTHGRTVITAYAGDDFRRLAEREWRVRPGDRDDFQRLLAEVSTVAGAPRQVVHLWSLSAPASDPVRAERQAGESLLAVVQALAAHNGSPLPRLWTATAGAAPGFAAHPAAHPWATGTLWGLAATVAAEYPEMAPVVIDVEAQAPLAAAEALWAELLAAPDEGRVAWRGGRRHVARLLPGTTSAPDSAARPLPIRGDATYLITGGTGALGLALAEWLVSKGARHLRLLARNTPNPDAAARISALAEKGAQVDVQAADVTNRHDIELALASVRATRPPLRGVFHLAGGLDDATLATLTPERYRAVLAPKVQGASNLHQCTAAEALDCFVLYSSAASLLGPPGQGAYAAANAALDALAYARRAAGLPALVLNWGPWQGGGLAAAAESGQWRRWGIEPLSPERALRALEHALALDLTQAVVMARSHGSDSQPGVAVPRFLSALFPRTPPVSQAAADELRERLDQAPPARRHALLVEALQREAVQILGLPRGTALDALRPLNEYGLDSLMAVEMRNAVARLAGQSLPVTLLFDYPTLDAAAGFLLTDVFRLETAMAEPVPADAEIASEIAALSEAEAEARLAETLAALKLTGQA